MSLSFEIGPSPGPHLHGYPLQFQHTKIKGTWEDLDCYLLWHTRLKVESKPLFAHPKLAAIFSAKGFAITS